MVTDTAFDILKRADSEFMSSLGGSSGASDYEKTGIALFERICKLRKKDPKFSRENGLDIEGFNMDMYDEGDYLCLSTFVCIREFLESQPGQLDIAMVPVGAMPIDLKRDRNSLTPDEKVEEDLVILHGTCIRSSFSGYPALKCLDEYANHINFYYLTISRNSARHQSAGT